MARYFLDSEVPEWLARELAQVGIIPRGEPETVGNTFVLAGQRFVITATATRQEYIDAATMAFPERSWGSVPSSAYFYKVSTD